MCSSSTAIAVMCSGSRLSTFAFLGLAHAGLYVYKTLSDHVLVLYGLYFLYHIHNEKTARLPACYCMLSQDGNYYPICSGLMVKTLPGVKLLASALTIKYFVSRCII